MLIPLSDDCSPARCLRSLNCPAPCLPGGRPAVAVAKPGSHPGCAGRSLMCDCSPARCLRSLMCDCSPDCDCSPNFPHPSRPAPGCWRRGLRRACARLVRARRLPVLVVVSVIAVSLVIAVSSYSIQIVSFFFAKKNILFLRFFYKKNSLLVAVVRVGQRPRQRREGCFFYLNFNVL